MKKIIYIISIFVLCIGLCGCSLFNTKETKKKEKEIIVENISGEDVEKIVDNYADYPDIDIIDIRSVELYEEKHIMGSMNVPYDELESISVSKDRELIVYGKSNDDSKKACQELIKMGYKKVKNMGSFDNYNGEYDGVAEEENEEDEEIEE